MQVLQHAQPRTLVFSNKEYFYLQCGILAPHHFVEIIHFDALALITLPVHILQEFILAAYLT
jgi:hypothetical protein